MDFLELAIDVAALSAIWVVFAFLLLVIGAGAMCIERWRARRELRALLRRHQAVAVRVTGMVWCQGDGQHRRHLMRPDQGSHDIESGWRCHESRVRADLARQLPRPAA